MWKRLMVCVSAMATYIARVRVAVRRGVDAAARQVERLVVLEVPVVTLVEHAVRKRRARADREQVALHARALRVHVEDGGARLVPAADHRAHAEAHALVRVHEVAQDLGRGRDRDALLVAQLVQAALHAEVRLPVLAVGGAAGHGAEQVRVDLDHLFHRAGRDVRARRRTRVDGNHDAALVAERKRGRAVLKLDPCGGVRRVDVGELRKEARRLGQRHTRTSVAGSANCVPSSGISTRGAARGASVDSTEFIVAASQSGACVERA